MDAGLQTVAGWFAAYGPWTLAGVMVLAGIGVPVPASLAILAAGALARQGRLDPVLTALAGLVGSVAGHVGSYYVGRKGLRGVFARLERAAAWRHARERFDRHRGQAVFLSRWLLTPLALPVNLLAGMERYPVARFVPACAAGDALWIALYGGAGYALGTAWDRLGEARGELGGWILAAGAVFLVILGTRRLAHRWREVEPTT